MADGPRTDIRVGSLAAGLAFAALGAGALVAEWGWWSELDAVLVVALALLVAGLAALGGSLARLRRRQPARP